MCSATRATRERHILHWIDCWASCFLNYLITVGRAIWSAQKKTLWREILILSNQVQKKSTTALPDKHCDTTVNFRQCSRVKGLVMSFTKILKVWKLPSESVLIRFFRWNFGGSKFREKSSDHPPIIFFFFIFRYTVVCCVRACVHVCTCVRASVRSDQEEKSACLVCPFFHRNSLIGVNYWSTI